VGSGSPQSFPSCSRVKSTGAHQSPVAHGGAGLGDGPVDLAILTKRREEGRREQRRGLHRELTLHRQHRRHPRRDQPGPECGRDILGPSAGALAAEQGR
jgi:hypothetical protein